MAEDWYFYSHRLGIAKRAIEYNYDVALVSRFKDHKKIISCEGIKIIPIKIGART